MTVDKSGWSGDGDFTIELLGVLEQMEEIAFLRVEDAPASRAGTGYNFLVNEVFVGFALEGRVEVRRRLGILPVPARILVPKMTLPELESRLSALATIGAPDYSDEGMLQFLRTERVVPAYQTRGYKMVEMVRVYEAKPVTPISPNDLDRSGRH